MRRNLWWLVVLVLAIVPARAEAAQDRTFSERLVALTNQERRDRGLVELELHLPLTGTSCDWNARILGGPLDHDPDLQAHVAAAVPNLTRWAENLARGQDPDDIFVAWLASPAHAPHIVDPDMRLIGICSDTGGHRDHWVTQRFAASGPAPAQAAPRPTRPRTTRPPATTASPPTTVAPTTTAPPEPSTTLSPTTSTSTSTETTTDSSVAPQVALAAKPASADTGHLSPVVVGAIVVTALVLLSAGGLGIARSRRPRGEA